MKFSVTVTLKKDVLDPQGKVVQNTLINMGMNNLKNIDLILDLENWINSGKSFLGICLGMQLAVIEFCRNVLNLSEANSSEFAHNGKESVICLIEELQENQDLAAKMG